MCYIKLGGIYGSTKGSNPTLSAKIRSTNIQMKVALFLDGDCYNNDEIFNVSSWLNRDNNCWIWHNLRKYFNERDIEIHTYDKYRFWEFDKAVFYGLYHPNCEHHAKCCDVGKETYYIAYEPPVIHHFNHPEVLVTLSTMFKKILTWQENLIDDKKFFRLIEGKVHPDMSKFEEVKFKDRKFACLLSSYRYSNVDFPEYRDLYSERFKIAKRFEEFNYLDSGIFNLYGKGFNKPLTRWPQKESFHFESYEGEVDNKIETICRYKFNICFENCYGLAGYVSEKIIHSFWGQSIPVYWGTTNPTDYFPQNTFIDMRNFANYEELYNFLINMTEDKFNEYLDNINRYLKSDLYQKYFGDNVLAKSLYDMLKD